jgi:hypothetical protein
MNLTKSDIVLVPFKIPLGRLIQQIFCILILH